MTNRANFYIDGFNIYHRICDYDKATNNDKNYRWLNYKSLCESKLLPGDTLGNIYFFTALTNLFGKESVQRHKRLIDALETYGIKVVYGYFATKQKPPKEKQTDVNIATQMIVDAALKRCEKIFLFSGDNDFAPALKGVKEVSDSRVHTLLMTPPYQEGLVQHGQMDKLKDVVNNVVEITFDSLLGHSLPEKIKTPRGVTILMPEEYQTF